MTAWKLSCALWARISSASSKFTIHPMITLALSKGRIFEETLPLLRAAGIEVLDDPETSRKLILRTGNSEVRLLVVRATDVPTYVQYGGADLGISGKDNLRPNTVST